MFIPFHHSNIDLVKTDDERLRMCFHGQYSVYCVCLKNITLCDCQSRCCSSAVLFQNIGEFGAKKYFTDHRTAKTIKLDGAIKTNFLFSSFSEQVEAKRNFTETSQ